MQQSLSVPAEFEIPSFYVSATPEETATALRLGATMFAAARSAVASEELAAAETRMRAETARIRAAADAKIAELAAAAAQAESARAAAQREHAARIAELYELQKSAEATARREERELTTKQLEARIRALEQELQILGERNSALQERRAQLEQGRDADIRVAEERTRVLLQTALEEKERAIQRAERTLATLQDAYVRQTEELRALADLIRRKPSANVKTKGNEYEEIFREKLIVAYGTGEGFALIDTARSGIGHAGDYLMQWGDHTILWEVKNYDKPVPTAEVDKFRRDMKENAQVRIGVMVSRYTPITGKTAAGDRTVEFVEGKMLIYLSNFEAMSDETLPSLMLLFRLWWESDKNSEESESKEEIIRTIERLHSAALKTKTEWRLHKSRAEEMLRWMATTVEEAEERLANALKALQGTAAASIDVPVGIFRDAMGDEKAHGWIQTILEFAVPTEGGSCVLNDLAELVGKKKALSRDTAKSHIRSVLLDTVIEPPKGKIPARLLGLTLKTQNSFVF